MAATTTINSALREMYLVADRDCSDSVCQQRIIDAPDYHLGHGLDGINCATKDHLQAFRNNRPTPKNLPGPDRSATSYKPRDADYHAKVKLAAEELRDAERAWLYNLNDAERSALFPPGEWPDDLSPSDASRTSRNYLELLWVSKGAKPSLLLHQDKPQAKLMTNRRVYECISPIIDKYGLEEYGFRLFWIPHPVVTEERKMMGDSVGYRMGWVFADVLSPEWDLARRVFFTEPADIKEVDVAKAQGYPTCEVGMEELKPVTYVDLTESKHKMWEHRGRLSGTVRVTQFFCSNSEIESLYHIGPHFDRYKNLAAGVGADLRLVAGLEKITAYDQDWTENHNKGSHRTLLEQSGNSYAQDFAPNHLKGAGKTLLAQSGITILEESKVKHSNADDNKAQVLEDQDDEYSDGPLSRIMACIKKRLRLNKGKIEDDANKPNVHNVHNAEVTDGTIKDVATRGGKGPSKMAINFFYNGL